MKTENDAKPDKDTTDVVVTMNRKYQVTLPTHRVTGREVKQAAIDQGVPIQIDFLLTMEAHEGTPARSVGDDETVTVTKNTVFTANDGDDNS
jgi:hypothetical protein